VITYRLNTALPVEITVYDVTGRTVARLHQGWQPAGKHQLLFAREALPSGVYFCQLRTPEGTTTRKLVIQ